MNIELPDAVLDQLADRLAAKLADRFPVEAEASPYMTVEEAAVYIRARTRQRVDDLLSSRRLTRFKEGRRTLVRRAELEALIRKET